MELGSRLNEPLTAEARQALFNHYMKEAERARNKLRDHGPRSMAHIKLLAEAYTLERCAWLLAKCA